MDVKSQTSGLNSTPVNKTRAAQRWATPAAFTRGISAMIGRPISLDVCAEAHTSKGRRHFGPGGIAIDAFNTPRPWASYLDKGSVGWCNPPFNEIAAWSGCLQFQRSGVWLLMVPPRTDTAWWEDLAKADNCHLTSIRRRVRFEPPKGVAVSSPPGGVVLWSIGAKRLPGSVDRDAVEALGMT